MNYCANYRQIRKLVERQVIRRIIYILLVMLFFICVSGVMDTISLIDRARLHRDADLLEASAIANRVMLDARARIQIALVMTGARRGAFTEEEKQIISENWEAAQYHFVEPNPFVNQ